MARHWSRLPILVFLVLLYASPLSSGDKGLWLSVAAMPVPLFGAFHGAMPAEHSILLPTQDGLWLPRGRVEANEPTLGLGPIALDTATIDPTWTTVGHAPSWSARDAIWRSPSIPRGPPA